MKNKIGRKTWFGTVFQFAAQCKLKMILAVFIEIISVIGGFVPYVGVYRIIYNFFGNEITMNNILFWSSICLGGYLIQVVCHGVATTLSHQSAYTILESIRLAMADKLLKAPLGIVIDTPIGVLKNNMVDRVETIELPLAHMIPEGISNLVLPVMVFCYLILIDWRMALASLISVPLAFIVYGLAMTSFNKKYAEFMESSNHVNSVIVEYVEGVEVIKAFGRSGTSYEKFSKAVKDFKDYTLAWFKSTWVHMNLGGAILPSTLLGTLPVGLVLYKNGSLSPSELIMCMILALGIIGPLTSFTVFVNDVKAIQFAVNDAKKILDLPELQEKESNLNEESFEAKTNENITFKNVSFSYTLEKATEESIEKNDERSVLNDISFEIEGGDFTALVGPSGSGKSTIARLISRFWDVDDGSISIGCKDLRKLTFDQLNDKISYVTQDNFLFDCSIKGNIRLGNPAATDEEVIKAAKQARCHDFIEKLDLGYDTSSGEAGTKLSGGEKQRIAIARTILKDSPIVILDEATAFTDPENEHEIQKSIKKLTEDKTLLVIAHRLSTIKNADKIIVMDNGKIVDQGKHESLIEECPLYKSMWEAHRSAKTWAADVENRNRKEVI